MYNGTFIATDSVSGGDKDDDEDVEIDVCFDVHLYSDARLDDVVHGRVGLYNR